MDLINPNPKIEFVSKSISNPNPNTSPIAVRYFVPWPPHVDV